MVDVGSISATVADIALAVLTPSNVTLAAAPTRRLAASVSSKVAWISMSDRSVSTMKPLAVFVVPAPPAPVPAPDPPVATGSLEPELEEPPDPEPPEPELPEPELPEPELPEPELAEPELAEPELDDPELDEPVAPPLLDTTSPTSELIEAIVPANGATSVVPDSVC